MSFTLVMLSTEIDTLCLAYLKKVYQQTHGYQAYSSLEQEEFVKKQVCITYGELLYPSVKLIINKLGFTSNDIFLDLGSGLGKCALQIFMQSDVKKIIGIEASLPLHLEAQQVLMRVKKDFPFFWENSREIILKNDNFLTHNWLDATVIYSCSTCFTQELLVAIAHKINQHPQIQKVLSLRPLPFLKMPLFEVFRVECSWDSALCFYYQN